MRWLFLILAMAGLMVAMNTFTPQVWSHGFHLLNHFIAWGYVVAGVIFILGLRGLKYA